MILSSDELVIEYLSSAMKVARYFYNYTRFPSVEWDDIKQAAKLGLCVAAKKYIPGPVYFPVMAKLWIKREILRYISDSICIMHVPETALLDVRRLKRFKDIYHIKHRDSTPSREEISIKLQISLQQLQRAEQAHLAMQRRRIDCVFDTKLHQNNEQLRAAIDWALLNNPNIEIFIHHVLYEEQKTVLAYKYDTTMRDITRRIEDGRVALANYYNSQPQTRLPMRQHYTHIYSLDMVKLTQRESQIISNLMQNQNKGTAAEIACGLGMSRNTFQDHITNILQKTKCASRREIVEWASINLPKFQEHHVVATNNINSYK